MRLLSEAAYEGWPEGTVGAHIRGATDCISPDDDVFGLVSRFTGGTHRRFPVADEEGKLIGIVTRRDVLGALELFRQRQERARKPSTYELIARRRG